MKLKGNKDLFKNKFIVSQKDGIIIQKMDALALLKDLNIKVSRNNKVNFVSVFKALIGRLFKNKKVEFLLTPTLDKKINQEWKKNFDTCHITHCGYSKFVAREFHAGTIIATWARRTMDRMKYKKAQKKCCKDGNKTQKQIMVETA